VRAWEPLIKVRVFACDPECTVKVVEHIMNVEYEYSDTSLLVRVCPKLREIIEKYPGLRPSLNPSMWESLVKAIVNQHVNMSLALRIISRLVVNLGMKLRTQDGEILYDFPSPEAVLRAGVTRLREMGLNRRKAEYIINIAETIVRRGYDLEEIAKLPPHSAVEELMKFKGVGLWTAKLTYMAYTGDLNLLLSEDLSVSRGLELAGCPRKLPKEIMSYAGLLSYLAAFLYENSKTRAKP